MVLEALVEPEKSLTLEARRESAEGRVPEAASGFSVSGVAEVLCYLYEQLGDPDRVLDVISRVPAFYELALQRAQALERKGLSDAALLVYSEYVGALEQRPVGMAEPFDSDRRSLDWARYGKARLLAGDGRLRAARDELARLYADSPSFPDSHGLRGTLERPRSRAGRQAIPEEVRHAVWRRDEGRCAQCGSQENLEFDHVIPVSRGGANTERNLQLLCEACNRSKAATV
jgi:hypothetical protein